MTLSCPTLNPAVYRPRKPEKTTLFEVIKKHFKTWVKKASEPVPTYVTKAFEDYLKCGILAHGFARAHCESCHHDFLIAFSCKQRGICPSCNTRNMVETAAHLVENLIPRVPCRQWVISFPKRIRYYLQTHEILQEVLQVVVDEVRTRVIACSPETANAQFGAVTFIQRFGSTLNLHPHFHLIVADGVFEPNGDSFAFHQACITPDDMADTQDHIHEKVLRLFAKRGWIDKDEIEKMLAYENSGFSLDAKVKIEAWDTDGLERLIRYCARPSFASENLRWSGSSLTYRLPKPTHTGLRSLLLDPLDFLDKIASLIPPPGRHRHHYHGVFAPNSPMRSLVAASAKQIPKKSTLPPIAQEAVEKTIKVSLNWAKLMARIYEVNPLLCPCGKEMRIVEFVTYPPKIKSILSGIGWPHIAPDFDPPDDLADWNISQLIPNTPDGFPSLDQPIYPETGPDPPHIDYYDPPHWEEPSYIVYD